MLVGLVGAEIAARLSGARMTGALEALPSNPWLMLQGSLQ